MEDKTLFPDYKPASIYEVNPLAKDFLYIYQQHLEIYQGKLSERDTLDDERDSVSGTDNPTVTNKRTNSSLAHKITYNFLKQLSTPSFQIICGAMSETERLITQSLFEDVLEKAGWRNVLTNKKTGAQKEYISFGDAVIGFGSNNKIFPFTYWNVDFNKIAVNSDANQFNSPGSEREVRKFVCVKEYQDTQFFAMYPQAEGKVTVGALPTVSQDGSLDNKTTESQKDVEKAKRIQVAYCYDLDYMGGLYMIVAGKNSYVIKELAGKNYPFRDRDNNAIIPYDGLTCFTRTKGFVNYGILQIIYKLGEMHRVLTNMGITYTLSNSNPVRIVATSQSETEFAGAFSRAQQRAKDGKVPVMVNKDGKEFGGVTTLQTNPIINEMNGILAALEKDLMQMGFNINDISTDTSKTLGALQLEVAAATSLVRYLQTENAPAYERLLQMLVQAIKERMVDDSEIILSCSASIRTSEGEINVGGVPAVDEQGNLMKKGKNPKIARSWTLEDLKQMLIKYPEIDIEVTGGVQNNPVLEDQFQRDMLALSDPTSKASAMIKAARAKKMGMNYEESDFQPGSGMPQQPQQPAPQAPQSNPLSTLPNVQPTI